MSVDRATDVILAAMTRSGPQSWASLNSWLSASAGVPRNLDLIRHMAGLVESGMVRAVEHGIWAITEAGREWLAGRGRDGEV